MTQEEIRIEFDQKIRNNFIKEHSICQYCGANAEHIHHLIPISHGGDNRQSNLIPLCMRCHGKIHKIQFSNKWKEAQKAGIERAKKEGKFKGRQVKELEISKQKQFKDLYKLYLERKITKGYMSSQLGVSRPTLNKHWDEWIKNFYNV